MEDTYGIIYCIENTINGHKYIGQTIRSFEERISEHFRSVNAASHKNRVLYKAINKYGKDNFKSYILDIAKNQVELDEKETYWINYYNTFQSKGYNMTSGGQNEKMTHENEGSLRVCSDKEFYVFDLNGNFLFERKSQTAFAKEIRCEHGSISGVLSGRKPTVKNYILIYKNKYSDEMLYKSIERIKHHSQNKPNFLVIDAKTNIIIGTWNNQKECSVELKVSVRSIQKQLNNGNKRPRKYIFIYETDYINMKGVA